MTDFDQEMITNYDQLLKDYEQQKAVNYQLMMALDQCRIKLGIRDDFVPLGPAIDLAPIINKAIQVSIEADAEQSARILAT